MSTAKKTMLKNSRLWETPLDHREGREHHRDRAAQPRPAEDQPLASAEAIEGGRQRGGERPRDERDHQGEQGSFDQHVAELTREDEQPEGEEERDLGHPGEALVEGGDRALRRDLGAAERQAGQIDGQEARAVDDRRATVGEPGGGDRGHRVEAGGLQAEAPERPNGSQPPQPRPTARPIPSSRANSQAMSTMP